jgi:uncharacterized protein (DUF1499 family)
MRVVVVALLHMLSCTRALRLPPSVSPSMQHRRGFLQHMVGAALALAPASAHAAIKPCPQGANNCWSTASKGANQALPWVWPVDTPKSEAISALQAVLNDYPQDGQSGVDLGGWSFAVNELASNGYARLEYKSGVGNMARFFNGGKPFVDDLELAVGPSSVEVRSSSRVGDSDFGVNAKRLNFLTKALRAKGWTAPAIAT